MHSRVEVRRKKLPRHVEDGEKRVGLNSTSVSRSTIEYMNVYYRLMTQVEQYAIHWDNDNWSGKMKV